VDSGDKTAKWILSIAAVYWRWRKTLEHAVLPFNILLETPRMFYLEPDSPAMSLEIAITQYHRGYDIPIHLSLPHLPSVLPHDSFGKSMGFHRYKPIWQRRITPARRTFVRSEPSSRTTLTGEQPDPWDLNLLLLPKG
jgi:hypothetical protein